MAHQASNLSKTDMHLCWQQIVTKENEHRYNYHMSRTSSAGPTPRTNNPYRYGTVNLPGGNNVAPPSKSHKRNNSTGVTLEATRPGTGKKFSDSQTVWEPFDTYKRKYKTEGYNPPYSYGGPAHLVYSTPEKSAKTTAKKANRGHNYYPFYAPPQGLTSPKHFMGTIKGKTWFTETLRQ